jgi:hypothetical protein
MNKERHNSILESYIKDHLSPTEQERNLITRRYEQLQSFLEGQCFQTGSYARFTSKRPVNDLDVIWRLPDTFLEARKMVEPSQLNPSQILNDLARHLAAEYQNAGVGVRIKAQSHSVGIYFGATDDEFSIDLVPAVATNEKNEYGDDMFWVPEILSLSKNRRAERYARGNNIQWIRSDPKGYIEDARVLNNENPAFRRVSKFIRKWRSACKGKSPNLPMKSFHLELIVADIFKEEDELTALAAVQRFFQRLEKYFVRPTFVDRAHDSQYVDSYVGNMSPDERNDVHLHARCAEALLTRLITCSSDAEVYKVLEDVLAGHKMSYIPERKQHFSLLPLDDYSHKQELYEAGIHDQGAPYPCTASLRAKLYFRGPRDKKINMRFQRTITTDTLIPAWHWIQFEIKTDAPEPYEVYWQVVNTGEHAATNNDLRGKVFKGRKVQLEHTMYTGKHWIEAFIIHNGTCIARTEPFFVNFINAKYPGLPVSSRVSARTLL